MNKTIALILTTALTATLSAPSAIASHQGTAQTTVSARALTFPPIVNDGTTAWNSKVGSGYDTQMYVQGTGARIPLQKPHYTIGQSTTEQINFHYSIPTKTGDGPFDNKNKHIRWQYNVKEDSLIAVPSTRRDTESGVVPSAEDREQTKASALAFVKALAQAQQ